MLTPSMRRRGQAPSALALIVLWLALPGTAGSATDSPWRRQRDDPIAVAKRQREAMRGRIETQGERLARLRQATRALSGPMQLTAARLDDITADLSVVAAEVDAACAELAQTEARYRDLVDQVSLLDWNLDQLEVQADELAADLAQRQQALGERLAETYRTGKTALWEQVLDRGSLVDVVVEQGALTGYARHDLEVARDIERDQAALDVRRRDIRRLRWETDALRAEAAVTADELRDDRDRLASAEARLAERQRGVAQTRTEQQAQFDRMARTRQEVGALLSRQRAQAERLTARVKRLLEEERHAGRLPSALNGRLRWPLIGRITQEFGCTGFALEPAYGDCEHFHRGIDIVRGYGDPIVAPGDGVILFVGYDPDEPRRDASWQVVIGHPDRLITVYGHLVPGAPPGIREGARVREGQAIGRMGNTANSTGAHLHWGVWYDGEPVNPRYFL